MALAPRARPCSPCPIIPAYAGIPRPIEQAQSTPLARHSCVGRNPVGREAPTDGAQRAPSPLTPSPTSFPRKREPTPSPSTPSPTYRHSRVGGNPVGRASAHGRGATRPVSMTSQPLRHSRESGNPPPLPPSPASPTYRHSRESGNPAPRRGAAPSPQRSNGAHLALKSAHSALMERSFGAHGALMRRPKALTAPRPAAPRPGTHPGARVRSLTPHQTEPVPRLPQAVHSIMTQSYCVPPLPLLS